MHEERAREAILSCLDHNTGRVGIIENDQDIEGCIGLRIGRMWYTEDWFLDELWNFVHPEYRRTKNADKLIEYAKAQATVLGVPLVMGLVTRKQLEPKMRLYQRKMQQIGAYFISGKETEEFYQQRKLGKWVKVAAVQQ